MKKKYKKIVIVFIVIVLVGLLFFTVDYSRARQSKSPLFSLPIALSKCSDHKVYIGLGYKVVVYRKFEKMEGLSIDRGINRVEVGTYFMKVTH